jgi:transcriptional regulator with XRE-family HTH domain
MRSVYLFTLPMHFPARLIQLRKQHSLTQQALADAVGIHVNQIKRYEAGSAQPTLETLVSVAKCLHVSLDVLVFNDTERDPQDELKLKFEAVAQMDPLERQAVDSLLDAMILKHQAKQFFTPSKVPPTAATPITAAA